MERDTFPYSARAYPVAAASPALLSDHPPEERIIVSVSDRAEGGGRRATVLENAAEAQRLVEALIAAGCDARDVAVFRSFDAEMEVHFHATVRLGGGGAALAGDLPKYASDAAYVYPEPPEQQASYLEESAAPPATPAGGTHFRTDRLVWICLWTVSVVILLASLMTSFSRPAPREFFPGAPSPETQRLSPEGAALDSVSAPVLPECGQDGEDDCRCSDFSSQAAAQVFYEHFPPAAGHIVDTDGDGLFCEWLPPAVP